MKGYGPVLGPAIGRGGEGTVHVLLDRPGHVAKVYHHEPDAAKRAHLAHLIAHAEPQLAQVAAWPVALERLPDGGLVLVERKVDGIEIHDFYGVASRLARFPGATWRDCVRLAARVAEIVATVHAAGFILADLNEQNILVGQDGEPVLIDVDSLMSTHDGRVPFGGPFRAEWLPPELIGLDLRSIVRTRNHDAFALALLLFRILMLGRHPFVGVPVAGSAIPDDAEAIASHHFVYAGMSAVMTPPAAAPSFALLPPVLQSMFCVAFGPQGRAERPSGQAWASALDKLLRSLRDCPAQPMHVYWRGLGGSCPWCALDPVFEAFPAPTGTSCRRTPRIVPPAQRTAFAARSRVPHLSWRSRIQAACLFVAISGCGVIASLWLTALRP